MLALDIDGVLADTNRSVHSYLTRILGVEPTGEATWYHGLHEVYPPVFQEDAKALIKLAFKYDGGAVYTNCVPFDGAVRAANWAAEQGILVGYITRRPKRVSLQTVRWLEEFGFPMRPILFNDGTPHKVAAMRQLGATVIVEDSPKEAHALHGAGFKVFLLDKVYNTSVSRKIERVTTLDEAVFWAKQELEDYKELRKANERLEVAR